MKNLSIATTFALLLLLGMHAPAGVAGSLDDFTIEYVVDSTGSVTYNVIGVYSAAIQCSEDWVEKILVSPLEKDVTITELDTTSSSPHTVRFAASLTEGVLRITEEKNGTVTGDIKYSCPSYVLDTSPSSDPTEEMVTATLTAPRDLGDCSTGTQVSEAHYEASKKQDIYNPNLDILANDPGICLDLEYAGMIPPGGATCPLSGDDCVPFSGNVEGTAYRKTSDGYDVRVEGRACSFLIVGGYCWELVGNDSPEYFSEPIWNPCTCDLTHLAKVYVTDPDPTKSITPMGTWGSRLTRDA